MAWLVSLIAAPDSGALDARRLEIVRGNLAGRFLPVTRTRVLAEGQAAELVVSGHEADPVTMAEAARTAVANAPIDVCVLPDIGASQRRKKLLVADMDATILSGESLDAFADAAGMGADVAEVTRRAMAGELDFAEALRERVALLQGLDADVIDHCIARLSYNPGARALVATMRHHGAYCLLVSGGFQQVANHVTTELGFDECRANRLEIEDGRLTGRVVEPVLGREAKLEALNQALHALELPAEAALAMGDGANDADMLEAAGLGVAYRGKPALKERADACLDHGDLTGALYLQGYTEDEIVAPLA